MDIHNEVISADDLPQEVDPQIPSNNDPLEEIRPQTGSPEAIFENVGPGMESTDKLPEETEDQMDFDSNVHSPPRAMDICQTDHSLELEPSPAIKIRAEENVVLEVQDDNTSRHVVLNMPMNLSPRAPLDVTRFDTMMKPNIMLATQAEDSTTMASVIEVSC